MAAGVTPEMRAVAKTANFAIIYGVSAFGLSQQTQLSVPEAKEFIETYFARYPRVKEYMDGSIRKAREETHALMAAGLIAMPEPVAS